MRMRPIFLGMCAIGATMMAWTFSLGWRIHYNDAHELIGSHFVWGMGTGLFISLIHSIVLVYFLGTGKAIKEQTDLQNWDQALYYLPSKKHMGRAVIPCVLGILGLIIAAFSGGFTLIQALPPWAHLSIAALGTVGQIPIWIWQYLIIASNGRLMDQVVERLGGDDIRLAL